MKNERQPSQVNFPDEFVRRLKAAKRMVVLTGAGVSAESGLPTFRGAEGMWKSFRPEDLATVEAFQRDPKLVWEWYDWRRGLVASAKPNAAHYAIARLEELFEEFLLITQNVDGLHRVAGNKKIVELHGNIWFTRCFAEGTVRENRDVPLKEIPPRCPDCGSLERPHIVWFGEYINGALLDKAWHESEKSDMFITVGTSGVIQPAAGMSGIARNSGAYVLEINLEKTPLYYTANHTVEMSGGIVLPEIVKLAESFS
ncbi:MAG: NAD-dependent deacylase [Nitrospinae bacterium]|nr:NAD-dependent deacylase [Nitrospinota bacterium]MBF0634143.1 NAD-dependent deacylase [Nitrospinota bacterium]